MKAGDVLADDVQLRGPLGAGRRHARGGPVVRERIEPDVRGLLLPLAGEPGEGDTPGEAGPARRNVVEALVEQRENLVAPTLRLHEEGVALDQLEEEIPVAGQPEEPVPLFHPFQRPRRVERAPVVGDFGVLLERLAADTIPAAIRLLVEVVWVPREDPLDQLDHACLVLLGGGPDELIVGDRQPLPHRLEAPRHLVYQLLRRQRRRRGGLGHLLPMLVHADQEPDVVAPESVVPRDRVGPDLLVGVAEVWVAVGVIDGGGDVKPGHSAAAVSCGAAGPAAATASTPTASPPPPSPPAALRLGRLGRRGDAFGRRRCRRRWCCTWYRGGRGARWARSGDRRCGCRGLGGQWRATGRFHLLLELQQRHDARAFLVPEEDSLPEQVDRHHLFRPAGGDDHPAFLGEPLPGGHVELVLVLEAAEQAPAARPKSATG